jgi:hypothetical protein
MGFSYVKSIFLSRATGEEHVGDKGGHGEKGMGIELEIMVREPGALTG